MRQFSLSKVQMSRLSIRICAFDSSSARKASGRRDCSRPTTSPSYSSFRNRIRWVILTFSWQGIYSAKLSCGSSATPGLTCWPPALPGTVMLMKGRQFFMFFLKSRYSLSATTQIQDPGALYSLQLSQISCRSSRISSASLYFPFSSFLRTVPRSMGFLTMRGQSVRPSPFQSTGCLNSAESLQSINFWRMTFTFFSSSLPRVVFEVSLRLDIINVQERSTAQKAQDCQVQAVRLQDTTPLPSHLLAPPKHQPLRGLTLRSLRFGREQEQRKKQEEQLAQMRENEAERKRILSSFEENSDGQQNPKVRARLHTLVDARSVDQYYKLYKRQSKVKEQIKLYGREQPVFMPLIEKSAKTKVLPMCLGLVKREGSKHQLELGRHQLGDKYLSVISSGLAHRSASVNQLHLDGNRISKRGASQLLQSTIGKLKYLDLSNNPIQQLDSVFLGSLTLKDCQLMSLFCSGCKLTRKSVGQLLHTLVLNTSVKVLSLSNNGLTDSISDCLGLVLAKGRLEELYLRWNRLSAKCCQVVFQCKRQLRVVDLSFNLLGLGKCGGCIKKFLVQNKTLVHLDLSCNKFTLAQSREVAEGLLQNHSLYGLHFSGNYGSVDSQGFLNITSDQREPYLQHNDFRIKGVRVVKKHKPSQDGIVANCCWLCEGWAQVEFKRNKSLFRGQPFLRLKHEGWRPRPMEKEGSYLRLKVMVPPTKIHYCISQGENSPKDAKTILVRQCPVLSNNYFQPLFDVQPRWRETKPWSQVQKEWTFGESVWAQSTLQSEQTFGPCFEADWQKSKIQRLARNEGDQHKLRHYLRSVYRMLANIFRQFSAIEPEGTVFTVSAKAFNEVKAVFFSADRKLLNPQVIQQIFAQTKQANSSNSQRYSVFGLLRFQFIECLVRVAERKYLRTKQANTLCQAVQAIIQQCIAPMGSDYDPALWRASRYYCQQCDLLLRKFRPLFEHVLRRYSRKEVALKPYLTLSQFKQICLDCQLLSDKFQLTQKDINLAFSFAVRPVPNQLQGQLSGLMGFFQFAEAFAKVCDGVELAQEDRRERPEELFWRLEWGVGQLARKCCKGPQREGFEAQTGQSCFQS